MLKYKNISDNDNDSQKISANIDFVFQINILHLLVNPN
ncbi:Hypothetical protein Ccan_19950 [Capnocytophaga canimorsus Cc5]|uniref:Uncharacterized protein n=1 Tax=Capnocytophaga canimorsus (strain 5) TaxID=860228 RepID=F9YTR6_CAPCC|nr:Hypothetical protein Ccan_19950 [Capnocytophaga canimorsus Cc5]